MTVEEAMEDKDTGIIIPYHATANYVEIDNTAPIFDPRFLSNPTTTTDWKHLKYGMDTCCVNAIVQDHKLMAARR